MFVCHLDCRNKGHCGEREDIYPGHMLTVCGLNDTRFKNLTAVNSANFPKSVFPLLYSSCKAIMGLKEA